MRRRVGACTFLRHSFSIFLFLLTRLLIVGIGIAACFGLAFSSAGQGKPIQSAKPDTKHRPAIAYNQIPISFEANQGQASPRVKFLARGPGYTMFLTGNSAVLSLANVQKSQPKDRKGTTQPVVANGHRRGESSQARQTTGKMQAVRRSSSAPCLLHVKLDGANPNAVVDGLDELPGKSNYYIGKDPKKWHTNIPNYAEVNYRNVYPGINLVYHSNHQQQLEYDFAVAPGADPNRITFDFRMAHSALHLGQQAGQTVAPRIATNGALVIKTRAGEVRFNAPVVYQPVAGKKSETLAPGALSTDRKYIHARYVLRSGHEIGFKLSSYDRTRPLIIDPVLTYGAYVIEGSGGSAAHGIGIDQSNNLYILGDTNPGTGYHIVVVFALNPQGNSYLYTTFFGGTSNTTPAGIAVDAQGDVYIDGTDSGGLPTTAGAYQESCPGSCFNAPFAAKLSPTGSLVYSTYLGPSIGKANAIAIDQSGDAYITGSTALDDLPVVNAFQPQFQGTTGNSEVFVQKLDPTGSQLIYSTYFGSTQPSIDVAGTGIAVDSSGSAYVVGEGSTIPLKNPLQQGVGSMFLAKFTPDGTGLVYSTLLGGSGFDGLGSFSPDTPTALRVDAAGNVYVTGDAVSQDFPMTMNAFKASCLEMPAGACSLPQVFVLKIDSTGSSLVYSTLLGAGRAWDVWVDSSGNAWVTGGTNSSYFPTIQAIESNRQQNTLLASDYNAFLTRLNSSGIPDFSTYLGGTFTGEIGAGVVVDNSGNAYVAGSLGAGNDEPIDFPIVNSGPGAVTTGVFNMPGAIFTAKISPSAGPAVSLSPRYEGILELRDVSSSPLTINSITSSSNMTLLGGTCGSSLPAGGGCTLIVSVAGAPNESPGTLTVSSNASTSPDQFTIYTSNIDIDHVLISPGNLEFPAQLVGTLSPTQAVTITNLDYPNGLGITGFQIPPPDPTSGNSGNFTQTNNCPTTLPAGSSCTINVQYQPVAGANGRETNSLNISLSGNISDIPLFGFNSSSSLAASAQTIQFGTQFVGATPLPRVVTLTNAATQSVSVGGVSLTGPFTQTNNCTAPLAPRSSCRVAVSFVPTSNQNVTGQLMVNFSGQGSPVTINLVATGEVKSGLDVSPFQLNFGNVVLGQTDTQPVTLSNVSNSTVTISAYNLSAGYTETDNCNGSLAPQATCTVNVSFTPTVVGEQDGTLSIDFSGTGSPQVIPLTAAGITPLEIIPTSLTFGEQALGTTSATQNVGLSDQGTTAITINGISISSGFQIVADTCPSSIQPTYACPVRIAFAPTVTGPITGTLTINASDSSTPHTVALSGTGAVVPEVSLSPASLSFASTEEGSTSSPQTVTLQNTGDATLTITSLAAEGDFAQTNSCGSSVAAGASCTISVTFSPTNSGQRTGVVTIADNAPDSPQTVSLSGTATAPAVTLSQYGLVFTSQAVNTTSNPLTVNLTNSGTSSLLISGISTTGDFAETNNCSGSIAVNATCTISVTFTPTASGQRTGTLTISDNAPNSPQTVPISGTGEVVDFSISTSSGSSSSATVAPGGTATFSLTVIPEGGFNKTITLACAGAPAKASCTLSPSSVTLDGTNPQNVNVTVTTTAPSIAPPGPFGGPPPSGGLAINYWWIALLIMIGSLALAFRCRKRLPLLAGAVLIAALAISCGGGGGGGGSSNTTTTPGTPAGTSTLTVTGTSGNLSHQTTVTLTVQ